VRVGGAILGALKDADMVAHMGAYADEGPLEKLLGPNIFGAFNIREAAHQNVLNRAV
tara:strand:+ start:953 stop:1123 length:171 start_codon:yes stop_codon:yes gene_type:complete